jgi:hypothetical protein
MDIESNLERIKKPTYVAMSTLLYICYFLIYAGLFYVNPLYLDTLSKSIRIFVCMFLIYKFHPFRQHKLVEFDAQLIFASAILILTDMGITQYLLEKYKDITKYTTNGYRRDF